MQEAIQKQEQLGAVPVSWHLIGHLQTNKARFVPGRFALVHSVDSQRVAEALVNAMQREEIGETGIAPLPVRSDAFEGFDDRRGQRVDIQREGERDQIGCLYGVAGDTPRYVLELPSPRFESVHDLIVLEPAE